MSKIVKVEGIKTNQIKLEVIDTYKKDEQITTNFEPTVDSEVIKQSLLRRKIIKYRGSLILIREKLQRIWHT